MRHNKLKKINKKTKHKLLMFNNMIYSLINHGKISTTISKYKIMKNFLEKKIKKFKKNKKYFFEFLGSKFKTKKNIFCFLKKIKNKNSGFLKIKKIKNRKGDFAKITYLII